MNTVSVNGIFSVCYCPSYTIPSGTGGACDDDSEFTHQAGELEAPRAESGLESLCMHAFGFTFAVWFDELPCFVCSSVPSAAVPQSGIGVTDSEVQTWR